MIKISENTTILHYQIKHLLARGGMSAIYLAHDTITNRDVAIKLVHSNESDYYERFRREARAVAQLEHDHILPSFDYGEYSGWFYMVMPYIEHGTLRERLVHGPLALQETGKILTQLADAVQYAHEQGIVHRDLKPSNVLLRDGEHVYLADFGLVRHVEEATRLTQTGFLIGTPEYMAPEMTEHPATPSGDIYALGIILYQMLTGYVPFNGSTPVAICLKHVKEQPLPPSAHNTNLSPAIDAVVLRALAKDPTQRFQHANDLANAFQAALYDTRLIHNTPTRKIPAANTKTRIGLLAVAAILLFLLPALMGIVSFSGHMPAATILNDSILNRGQTLTKPPIAHPVATKSPSPTPHKIVITRHVTNTHRNTGGGGTTNHSGNGSNHGNSSSGGNGSSHGNGNGGGNGNGNNNSHGKGNGGGNGNGHGKGHGKGGGHGKGHGGDD